jgi:hypothetical protein
VATDTNSLNRKQMSPEAFQGKKDLQAAWKKKSNSWGMKGYRLCFDWNSETGEPWFAVRLYSINAQPAIQGPGGSCQHMLQKRLIYINFKWTKLSQYTLIWPEFRKLTHALEPLAWDELEKFRSFIQFWLDEKKDDGRLLPIRQCYESFELLPIEARPSLTKTHGA